MGKNIILCADGTGSKGGYTPDSNVYKIYKAIDIHNKDRQQTTFYDNGIGTETNKYVRAATGALGLGFKTNVCDLYAFLARNYERGDRVYLFGFSRGASTIRAFAGFIATCGLVDGKKMKENELQDSVKEAYKAYVKFSKKSSLAKEWREGKLRNIIPIKFIGVWDTVSSLGFPQKWTITSIGMLVLNVFFKSLDYFSDLFFPHRFYNYKLTENVEYACQALAIDDERTSFWPMVWNEKNHSKPVEQVWFAGMHSNVGGGYHRAGMAHVALEWMMVRAQKQGLIFKNNFFQTVHDDANPNGRIYDSRDGFAFFYRYHPREIKKLCKRKLMGNIKIHHSVIERMECKTANYAPGNLPMDFDVVTNDGAVIKTTSVKYKKEREVSIKKINRWVFCRKWLYGIFLESTIAVAVFALIWKNEPLQEGNGIMGFIGDKMNSALPDFLNGAISVAVIQHPVYFWGALFMLIICWIFRYLFRSRTVKASEELREQTLAALNTLKQGSQG